MDQKSLQSLLQKAHANLEKKEKREKKRSRKQEKLVIRATNSRIQAREERGLQLAEARRERARTLREQYQASAVGIMEAFAKEIGPAFQRMMEAKGDKLDGARIILYCSKSDYSGGHAIVCLASPQSKTTLHRSELAVLLKKADDDAAVEASIIQPEPVTNYNPLLDPAVTEALVNNKPMPGEANDDDDQSLPSV